MRKNKFLLTVSMLLVVLVAAFFIVPNLSASPSGANAPTGTVGPVTSVTAFVSGAAYTGVGSGFTTAGNYQNVSMIVDGTPCTPVVTPNNNGTDVTEEYTLVCSGLNLSSSGTYNVSASLDAEYCNDDTNGGCNNTFNTLSTNFSFNVDATPPTLSTATVMGNSLVLTYDRALNTGSVPSTGDFTVNVDSGGGPGAVSKASVGVSGSTVTITLSSSVSAGDIVTIDYNPSGSPIESTLGNDAVSLSSQAVSNNTSTPTLSSASIDGNSLTLTYDRGLNTGSVPLTSDFVVNVNASPVSISGVVTVLGSDVTITLSSLVIASDSVTIDYTPASNTIQDTFGTPAAALSGQVVTNNTSAPTLSSATVSGSTLVLTYNKTLDSGSIPSTSNYVVKVNGSAVSKNSPVVVSGTTVAITLTNSIISTDDVTIDYTPGVNRVRSVGQSNAGSLSGQPVANNENVCLIPTGSNPYISAVVGDKIYVSNFTSGSVTVIDSKTNQVIKIITVGSGPYLGSVVDNKLYIPNHNDDTFSVINTTTDTVIDTVTVGDQPYYSVAYGNKIYSVENGTVSVINTVTDAVTTISSVGNVTQKPTVVGNKIYVPNTAGNSMDVINTSTDTVSTSILVGVSPSYSTAIGTKLYVNNANNRVSVIDTQTDTVSDTILLSGSPLFSAAVGTDLYVNSAGSNNVFIIDTLTDNVSTGPAVGLSAGHFTVYNGKVYIGNSSDSNFYANGAILTIGTGGFISMVSGTKLYVSIVGGSYGVAVIDLLTDTLASSCGNPILNSFTSNTASGSYSSGQSINIKANFDKVLASGSTMTVVLNTGATVLLDSVSSSTLSGTYTIGGGESTPDLSVSTTTLSGTNVTDISGHNRTDYYLAPLPSVPGSLVAENSRISRNIGDTKDIIIGSYVGIPVGTNPYQISSTVTVGGIDYKYVANQGSNDVSVLRLSDNTVVDTLTVGGEPYGLTTASISGTTYVYVANIASSTVSVINTATNSVTATISVGVHPYYVEHIGTNIYVTNGLSNTVSVINGLNNTVTATIPVGTYPRGIKAHGTDLYVANFGDPNYGGGNSISVIDSTNNTIADTIILPRFSEGPRGVTVNGSEVYVSNYWSNNVSVINTSNNTVTNTIGVGYGPRGLMSLGSKVYVENFDGGTISVIATGSHTVTNTIFSGHSPAGMSVNGTDIYFTRFQDNKVSILDTTNNTLKAPDVTVPVVSLTSPSAGTISGSSVSLTATATDDVAVAGVEFYINSTLIGSEDTGSPYSETLDTTGFSNGSYSLVAVARDTSGNVATSTPVSVTVTNGSGQSGSTDPQLNSIARSGAAGGGSTGPAPSNQGTTISVPNNPVCKPGELFSSKTGIRCPALPISLFYRDLRFGMSGVDVKNLQTFLNSHKHILTTFGPGSPGYETTFFGSATKKSLTKFQSANSIPATGFFGPITREFVNGVLSK